MNRTTIAVLGISLLAIAPRTQVQAQVQLKDQKDKVSYGIGQNIGNNFKQQGVEVNFEPLFAGIKDAITGAKAAMTPEQIQETMMAFQREMMAKQAEQAKALGDKNQKEGEKFLAENKKKPDVKTSAKGLQYKVITEGKGKKPTASDSVRVHYKGTLIDGTEFDSSYKRGEPVEFEVGGVIPGWTEALQLMPVGSKWQLFIPSDLAYGERGSRPAIGPNATLIFDVELLAIVDAAKEK